MKYWPIRALLIACTLSVTFACHAEIDWNDKNVQWYGYEKGKEAARLSGKSALLIVYADWCGVCKQYSKMFLDPEVVAASKNVVLVRLNQDKDGQYLQTFDGDGDYVPRTYLLDKNFKVQPSPFQSDRFKFYLPPDSNQYLIGLFKKMGATK